MIAVKSFNWLCARSNTFKRYEAGDEFDGDRENLAVTLGLIKEKEPIVLLDEKIDESKKPKKNK
jgi:hypothetical protein